MWRLALLLSASCGRLHFSDASGDDERPHDADTEANADSPPDACGPHLARTDAMFSPNPTATVDLTAEGPLGWAVWDADTDVWGEPIDRKLGGLSVSIGYSANAAHLSYTDNVYAVTWSDGTPTQTGTTTIGRSVYRSASVTQPVLTVAVPADTAARKVRIYCDVYEATATISASLSDASASLATDTLLDSGPVLNAVSAGVIEFDYAAGSAGQTLNVLLRLTSIYDPGSGDFPNVAIIATASAPGDCL